jgi:DNA-binding transcriptional regulator PaaX
MGTLELLLLIPSLIYIGLVVFWCIDPARANERLTNSWFGQLVRRLYAKVHAACTSSATRGDD